MKEMAIKKLSEELRGFKGNRCAAIMKDDVNKTLRCFCEQDREFAQAVVQGGSFSECMAEVAKKSGYSACYICHICKGKVNNPRIETVYDLARALNVSPAWLAGWTEVK